jgi:hypothetical protein
MGNAMKLCASSNSDDSLKMQFEQIGENDLEKM